ncbi:MAG: GTPase Era, partial [Pseudomonadales bacterium]
LFVDTPGLHSHEPRAINKYMNRSARSAIQDVDVILFMVDRDRWQPDDELVAGLVASSPAACILAVNKIDRLPDKQALLPLLAERQASFPSAAVVPVSAETGDNLDTLRRLIAERLPASPFYFDESQVTDRSVRFLAAEIIREKLMRQLGDELPYALTIQIERFEEAEQVTHIDATIFVEKEGQKQILIGRKGERIKQVGTDARRDLEKTLGTKVMLTSWVKVKSGWSDDERAIQSLGYD